MKTLYLHIGMPKTGTSYLQSFLRRNNDALKQHNFIYPDFNVRFKGIGSARNAYFLINLKYGENREERLFDYEKVAEDSCFDTLVDTFKSYDNVILSDEGIWNSAERNRGGNFWNNLKERLDKHGINIKIIAYLRRQDAFIQSYWAQRVKTGAKGLPSTIGEFMETDEFKFIKLNYYKRLERISKFLGRDSVIVRPYEKSQFKGNSLSVDFLDVLGLEYDESFSEPERFVNPSLTGIYLRLIMELNKVEGFEANEIFPRLVMIEVAEKRGDLGQISSDSFMTYKEAHNIRKKYGIVNRKVARDYLGREDMKLFTEPITKESYNAVEYSMSDYMEIIADMLTVQHDKAIKYSAEIDRLKCIIDELRLESKEQRAVIRQTEKENKKLQSTVEWMSASLPKKVVRKLKNTFTKTKARGEQDEHDIGS